MGVSQLRASQHTAGQIDRLDIVKPSDAKADNFQKTSQFLENFAQFSGHFQEQHLFVSCIYFYSKKFT